MWKPLRDGETESQTNTLHETCYSVIGLDYVRL